MEASTVGYKAIYQPPANYDYIEKKTKKKQAP